MIKIPYQNNSDLPRRVREAMPTAAQSIFRNTFNSVIDQEGATEVTAFAQAYGAVENAGYHQNSEGDWVKKQLADFFNKFNPHHGKDGRFATSAGSHSVSWGTKGPPKTTAGSSSGGSSGGGGTKETKKELTTADKDAIFDYTGGSFEGLNTGLRADKNSKEYKKATEKSKKLDNALDKLPPHKGDVYRTMKLDSDSAKQFLNSHKAGSPVAYSSFTSTSSNKDIAGSGIGGNVKVNMVIKSKTGRDVSQFSNYPGEKEILFPRDSKFVVAKTKKYLNTYTIELHEVA